MTKKAKLTNICPVFLSDDVKRTTEYYVHELGFKYAAHFDKEDNFATIYRDSIEIVIEDIDGRNIGFGLIANKDIYFENSNLLEQ